MWDIEANHRTQTTNNEDILDYVSEPLNLTAQKKIGEEDKDLLNNMEAMRSLSTEGSSDFLNREANALRDGQPLPVHAPNSSKENILNLNINPISYDEE